MTSRAMKLTICRETVKKNHIAEVLREDVGRGFACRGVDVAVMTTASEGSRGCFDCGANALTGCSKAERHEVQTISKFPNIHCRDNFVSTNILIRLR